MLTGLTAALLPVLCACMIPASVYAQEDYRFDMGGGIGMTGYLGDANGSNPWSMPSWDAEVLFRYIANPRWALKTNFYVGGLRGDSQKIDNKFPDEQAFRFSTTIYELG